MASTPDSRATMLLLALLACDPADPGDTADSAEETLGPAPTVEWVNPASGGTVAAGDINASVAVSNFTFVNLGKHSEGAASGYLSIRVDETDLMDVFDDTFYLPLDPGEHDLRAALYYEDGDAVIATPTTLCEENDASQQCEDVAETIQVTVQ